MGSKCENPLSVVCCLCPPLLLERVNIGISNIVCNAWLY